MQLRPASRDDVDHLARLIVGDMDQASTVAGMRLFGLDDLDDVIELNRVMIDSTEGWRVMTIADVDGPAGMVQVGEAFLALTPEVVTLAQRLYGESFQQIIGSRLEVLERVQTTYPDHCLRISEIHVSPEHRSEGIGTALFEHVVARAHEEGIHQLGLQTLTNNPARQAFEAWGFEVADTKTDPAFEELTGAAGYHLMLREV